MIGNRAKVISAVGVLAIAALVGCGEGGGSESEGLLAPSHSVSNGPKLVSAEVSDTTSQSAWIGSEGGSITRAGHTLTVPANAVSEPTLFRMRPIKDGYIKVDLTAWRDSAGTRISVGERGFAVPVQLTLTYKHATESVDPATAVVVWLKDDGTIEVQPSTVDSVNTTVTGSLSHFSQYGMAD